MDRDTLINHMRDVARQRASMMTDEEKLNSAKVTTLFSIREETQRYLAAYYTTIEELQAIIGYTREEATAIVDEVKDDIHQQALIEMPEWARGDHNMKCENYKQYNVLCQTCNYPNKITCNKTFEENTKMQEEVVMADEVRYWVHHESSCIWKTNTDQDAIDSASNPEVEEINRKQYYELWAAGYKE